MLSYGNCIVYALCVPALHRAYLHPAVGFLHEPGARRHSLALDMAEPIKPILVDATVLRMALTGWDPETLIEEKEGACLLNSLGRKRFREEMKTTIERFLGKSGEERTERFGWSRVLWDNLDRFAQRIASALLADRIPERWSWPVPQAGC
jgi:CRISPR-associated protein Cas1